MLRVRSGDEQSSGRFALLSRLAVEKHRESIIYSGHSDTLFFKNRRMTEQNFRCEGDLALYNELMENDEVKAAIRKLDDSDDGRSTRRQLLATALRLTKSMSPRLYRMMESSRKQLGIDIEVETYVYNSPQFNAACIKPENDRLLLMFSSSILEKFDEQEIRFVMGHELGHHLFGHTDIPIGYLVKGPDPVGPRLALKLFSWSRYAEISADRAGAICAKDRDATARALFKLASGLTTDLIEIRIDDFAAQADLLDLERPRGKDDDREDWFMTHPFTPLRVKALRQFFESELILVDGGISREQLEGQTHDLMGVMAPTYLEEKSEAAEMMRRVLFAAGCGVMNASGGISKKEIAAFNSLFGEGTFSDNLDLERLESTLDDRIADTIKSVPLARRLQIIRDLVLLSKSSGRTTKKEREYVADIANRLELSQASVDEAFENDYELD